MGIIVLHLIGSTDLGTINAIRFTIICIIYWYKPPLSCIQKLFTAITFYRYVGKVVLSCSCCARLLFPKGSNICQCNMYISAQVIFYWNDNEMINTAVTLFLKECINPLDIVNLKSGNMGLILIPPLIG